MTTPPCVCRCHVEGHHLAVYSRVPLVYRDYQDGAVPSFRAGCVKVVGHRPSCRGAAFGPCPLGIFREGLNG